MYFACELSRLWLIADFDGTLTQFYRHGQHTPSLTHVLRSQWYLSESFTQESQKLYEIYKPLESDPNLTLAEKSRLMTERYTLNKKLLIAERLHRSHIQEVAQSDILQLRVWHQKFFEYIRLHQIPLIIMSASWLWYDAIYAYLVYRGLRSDQIHIISNQCIWDSDGYMIDFVEPLIHPFNKHASHIIQDPCYADLTERKDILLLGNMITDLQMSEWLSYDRQYTVAWCETQEELGWFQEHFDLVIWDDGPMDPVNQRLWAV